jgi:oxygen-independent coproporphyrinogen-3 oxidase
MQSALIEKAREIQGRLPIREIKKFGIERSRDRYFLNIAYPSLQAMGNIEPKVVINTIPSIGNKVALYLHIPFCTRLCYYCHYYKVFNASQVLVEAYLTALMREVTFYSQTFGGLQAESIYIGGGTPSYLTPNQIGRLFEHLGLHVAISPGAEITFEMHPESVTLERLETLRACGVNRISMGVESFNDAILASENRGHTVLEALNAYGAIAGAGFKNVNLDLIYGLKNQTISIWEENLERICELEPASMCAYYLRVKTSTPDAKLYQSGAEGFPSEEDLLLMHIMTFEAMKKIGYEQLIVDWFSKTAEHFHKYQDHNWRQTDRIPLLGLGASAYSYLGGIQYYNINNITQYIEWLNKGRTAIWRGEVLSPDERMRRTAVLGLKMGINRHNFTSTYGVDFCEKFASTTKWLEELGLLRLTPESIHPTYLGSLFADEVCRRYYSPSIKRRMATVDPLLISTTHPKFNP